MASSLIHIVVANEINKKINRDSSKLLIGTISPDISKLVGEPRFISHFSRRDSNIPNLEKFLNKYKNNLNDDFVLGYYIHLYVDYLWFKYFLTEIYDEDIIKTLDGKTIKCSEEKIYEYIYNDYTNLNTSLIDEYKLDLKIFYNEIPEFNNIIEEIPMDKIKLVVDNAGVIIKNATTHKTLLFNTDNIKKFISLCVEIIYSDIVKYIWGEYEKD